MREFGAIDGVMPQCARETVRGVEEHGASQEVRGHTEEQDRQAQSERRSRRGGDGTSDRTDDHDPPYGKRAGTTDGDERVHGCR